MGTFSLQNCKKNEMLVLMTFLRIQLDAVGIFNCVCFGYIPFVVMNSEICVCLLPKINNISNEIDRIEWNRFFYILIECVLMNSSFAPQKFVHLSIPKINDTYICSYNLDTIIVCVQVSKQKNKTESTQQHICWV